MSDKNQWIPPGFRTCTWEEADVSPEDSRRRIGIHKDCTFPDGWLKESGNDVAWLCIDTPKPQHADKSWVKMGFEECSFDEAPRDGNGKTLGMYGQGIEWATASRKQTGLFTPLRPSPLFGLKRALEMLTVEPGHVYACSLLLAEIAKYDPPVCGECGRVK